MVKVATAAVTDVVDNLRDDVTTIAAEAQVEAGAMAVNALAKGKVKASDATAVEVDKQAVAAKAALEVVVDSEEIFKIVIAAHSRILCQRTFH